MRGLKTTYYLRTMGATHAEKSTVKSGALNAVPMAAGGAHLAADAPAQRAQDVDDAASNVKFCSIDNPDCEACQ